MGFRFAPRIRDLADRRLFVTDGRAVYTALNPMIGGTLDSLSTGLAIRQWPEVILERDRWDKRNRR